MREIVLQRHLLCWQNTIAVAVSQTQSCSIFFERARERDREKGTFKVKSLGSYYLSSSKSSSPPQTGKERCGWKKESKKEWNLNYVLAIRTNSLFLIAALETRLPWPSQSKSHTFLHHLINAMQLHIVAGPRCNIFTDSLCVGTLCCVCMSYCMCM